MVYQSFATDNTTFVNQIGLVGLAAASVLILALPRRRALVPVLVLVCFMTMGQRLLIFGLNFTMIRLLLLAGFVRVFARGEHRIGPPSPIDKAMLWWTASSIITYTALWGTFDAFVNRLGLAYDAVGLYFLFRALLRDVDDLRGAVRQFAWLVIPLALAFTVEKSTGHNLFGALGGVPPDTLIRDGVLRCQGPFAHPILAGAFGSTMVPLFFGMWWGGDHRKLALFALAAAFTIVICAGSSGPLLASVAGILALGAWPMRNRMRALRWAIGLTVLALHLLMKAPVWFLMARASVFEGSTGYHRAILIDHAVHNFSEWWLVGTHSTAHWGYYMFDVTNQYVLIGVQGGILSLILFLLIIARSFGAVGHAVKTWGEEQPVEQKLAWSLGASLMVHAVNYISVPYFDQNIVNWYLLLAMIATAGLIPQRNLGHSPSPPNANNQQKPGQGSGAVPPLAEGLRSARGLG